MRPIQSPSALWLTEFNTPWDACCHGIVKVLYQAKTAFQDMMIVETGAYGKALVLDGCWQSSTRDEFMYHEPLVHPACVIHGSPERVLILGGGEGAALREVLKWKTVKQAVLVDLDGEVVEACKRYLPEMHQGSFDNPRSQVIIQEARSYLQCSDQCWDVIISDLTDPNEDGPSQHLFTREFFMQCKQMLKPGGCFLIQAGLTGPAEMGLYIRLAAAVADVFGSMYHYHSPVPTWGSAIGFVLGVDQTTPWNDPPPDEVDALLSRLVRGDLRIFDGRTMRALMNPPKYLRDAVAKEGRFPGYSVPPGNL